MIPSIKKIKTKKPYNLVGDAGFIIDTNKISYCLDASRLNDT
jgi:hypothetical protein